jgi:BCD family chlorophyll transporter-like MFS transporter
MGVWGAAQAIAFGLGGMIGTGIVDAVRWASGSVETAYGVVFCGQAALFLAGGWLAARMPRDDRIQVAGETPGVPTARHATVMLSAGTDR